MQKKIQTRVLIIVAVTLAGLAIVFRPHHKPTMRDFTSWSQIKLNLADNIHLGLDLKGGSHLVLQVQTDEVIRKITQQNVESAKSKLREKNLPFEEVHSDGIGRVVVLAPDSSKNSDIVSEIRNDFGRGWSVDEHGSSIVATMDDATQNEQRDRATDQAKAIIENRVNAFGVTEPTVQRQGGQGTYQILDQMPGVDDPERVKNTLNADSNLELKLVAKGTSIPYPTKEQAETAAKSQPPGTDPYTAQYETVFYRERPDAGGAIQEG